jgi:hypothetical protein
VSLFIALLRNVFFRKESDFSHIDINTILTEHFSFYYPVGNFLFCFCLFSNRNESLEKYGLNCLSSMFAFIFYMKCYYSHMKKRLFIKLDGFFNFMAFTLNISFLLAWNVAYVAISSASFLSFFDIEIHHIISISISLEVFLCIFVILTISYFRDIYFCFIILIFQVGNTLNKLVMSYRTEITATDENNINLALTGFTSLCFIFGLFFTPPASKGDEAMEELNLNYLEHNKFEQI